MFFPVRKTRENAFPNQCPLLEDSSPRSVPWDVAVPCPFPLECGQGEGLYQSLFFRRLQGQLAEVFGIVSGSFAG